MFRACPMGTICLKTGSNPNYGFTNFDSFGWSLLALLRIMMQDLWENLLKLVRTQLVSRYTLVLTYLSHLPVCHICLNFLFFVCLTCQSCILVTYVLLTFLSVPPVCPQTIQGAGKTSVSVFVLAFFPGCFLVLSLIVAVVAMTLAEQKEAESAEAQQQEEEYNRIVRVLKKGEEMEEQVGSPGWKLYMLYLKMFSITWTIFRQLQ